jgi:hypothetical protein
MADDTASAPTVAPPSPKETAPVTAAIAEATEVPAEGEAIIEPAAAPAPPADKEPESEKPAEGNSR